VAAPGIVLVAALGALPSRARAAAETEWSARAEAKMLYTTNVFQFSATRRLALSEDPSQPTIVPTDRPSDVVWDPSIEVRRASANRFGDMDISAKAHGYLYTDHSIFNHGDYRIQVKQAVSPDMSVLARYRYVPNLFLGPNTERQTGLNLLEEERVTSHSWRLQVERRVAEASVVTLVGRYGLRFYNEAFSERDTHFWTVGPQLEQRVRPWLTLTLSYLYERGLADGRNEPQFKDDISYYQHFMSAKTVFDLTHSLSLDLSYVYRRKEFTSGIVGDSNRGVNDVTHQGIAEFRYLLTDAAAATLGFQQDQRTSNSSSRGFYTTNTWLGVRYKF
jgi:hypothetical protein